ncbi:MAG: thioredoxin family protein [Prolixibacteraceae bacterium]|jgi:small redox-active disulfide protein 2|nr:thioredoxin family protein [Prolixibacteraceae bacterium]MDD4755975.1 thioredoxin family protein [Prolixibacteraceae bacterium]
MEIKILGTGCPKCISLEKAARQAVDKAKVEATVSKVEDILKIMQYGVMVTPALVVDGKVVVQGRVAGVEEIMNIINK